jgi:hypothetical protein
MTTQQIIYILHSGSVCVGEKFISPDGLIVEVIDEKNIRISQKEKVYTLEAPGNLCFINPPLIS